MWGWGVWGLGGGGGGGGGWGVWGGGGCGGIEAAGTRGKLRNKEDPEKKVNMILGGRKHLPPKRQSGLAYKKRQRCFARAH